MAETQTQTPVVTQLADLVSQFVADTDAAALALRTGRPRGVITGFKRLDENFGGYLAPGIHILQAAPGAGKTAFALQVASDCCFPALYISTEMGLLELFRRLVARSTSTFLGKLKSGEISGKEAERLALATAQKLPHLALMDATQCFADETSILENANNLRERFKSNHVLIVLDSLQMWARSARGVGGLSDVTDYDLINSSLKTGSRIGLKLQAPILAVAHRNREGNKKDGGLHASKGSGDLEYTAETVIDLTRKSDTPDANGDTEVKATFHKNRHGVPGLSFSLMFSGRLQSFRET